MVISIAMLLIGLSLHATPFKQIRTQNLESLVWEDEDWSENSCYGFLVNTLDLHKNPQPYRKRNNTFNMLGDGYIVPRPIIGMQEARDLHLLVGSVDSSCYLGSIIARTQTELGRVMLYTIIAQPTSDLSLLYNRQMIVRLLYDNEALLDELRDHLQEAAILESMVGSFWFKQDPYKNLADRLYYAVPFIGNALNNSPRALSLKQLMRKGNAAAMTASTALVATLIPLWVARQAMGSQADSQAGSEADWLDYFGENYKDYSLGSLGPYLTGLVGLIGYKWLEGAMYGGFSIYNGLGFVDYVEWQRDLIVLESCLHTKMLSVKQFLHDAWGVHRCLREHPEIVERLPFGKEFEYVLERCQDHPKFAELIKVLQSSTFDDEYDLASSAGDILYAYKLFKECRGLLEPLFKAIGSLDAFCSAARWMHECNDHACFVDFMTHDTPVLDVADAWNPFLAVDVAVPNTVTLGGESKRCMIITGPNAGGKSTIMKSIALNVVLAQSFGIAAASSMQFTPCHHLLTYLNIVDDIASGNSGFKMAVVKAHECLERIAACDDKEFCFLIMDEAFKETNPTEAQAASYSVTQHIGGYSNVLGMFATHYDVVTQLGTDDSPFSNYKVSFNINEDDQLYYPYTLTPGISDQHSAIAILRHEGFSHDIMDTAEEMVRTING